MACSRNNCCHGNVVVVVDQRVAVNNIITVCCPGNAIMGSLCSVCEIRIMS